MKIPKAGSGFEHVLAALWENQGPMRIADLAKAANVSVDTVTGCGQHYGLRTETIGLYELPQSYEAHFNRLQIEGTPQALQIAQPREAHIWTAPMANYELSIRRRMRTI